MFTPYNFRLARESLLREKWINLLSALTIAVGLLLASLAHTVVFNIEAATRRLPERFLMTVYLKDGISDESARGAASAIGKIPSVRSVKYISREDALKELKTLVRDSEHILEGLDENPLPASVEVALRKEAVSEASVKALSKEFKKVEGVEDVSYGEKFLASIQKIKAGAEGIGLLIVTALSAGIVFVCYSTVKILFYRRKDEIDTLQLLGATRGFIRAPFVIEGGVIGMAAGVLAACGVWGIKVLATQKLASVIPIMSQIVFPPSSAYYLPAAGLVIGVLGALIALGRIRF